MRYSNPGTRAAQGGSWYFCAAMKLRLPSVIIPGAILFVAITSAALAYAGSYLDRSAILLADTRRANDWILAHLSDREMSELLHDVAEARLKSARKMSVPVTPKEVAMAHPHLLLALETSERAAAAAAAGQNEKFLAHLRTARDEDATFRSLLSAAKLDLPSPDKK